MSSSARRSALGSSKAVAKKARPSSLAQACSSLYSPTVELERFAVLSVRDAERVLVLVRRLVRRARVERAVVPLLELDGVHTTLRGGEEELLRLFHRALVVVADLGDDVAVAVVRDSGAVDDEFAHGFAAGTAPPMVPRAPVTIGDNRRLGTAAFILGFALIAATAWLVAASLSLRDVIDFLLAAFLCATGAIVVLVLVLSPFEALTRGWLLAGSGVLAAIAVLVWAWRGRPAAPPLRPAVRAGGEALRDPVVAIPAAAVGAGLVYSVVLAIATPPNDYDTLWYHLSRAAFWRQEHAVGYVERANDLRLDVFTPGAELVSSWAMTLSGDERFAALFQLFALLATMLAVAGIARALGLDRRAAALGAVLFASLPVVVLQASTALNDLALASFLVIVVYFVLRGERMQLALGALALALAVATKATALLALPVLALLAFGAHSATALARRGRLGGGRNRARRLLVLRQPRGDRELHPALRPHEPGRRRLTRHGLREVPGAAQPARDRRDRPGRLRGDGTAGSTSSQPRSCSPSGWWSRPGAAREARPSQPSSSRRSSPSPSRSSRSTSGCWTASSASGWKPASPIWRSSAPTARRSRPRRSCPGTARSGCCS